MGRDLEEALFAGAHVLQRLLPALDDLLLPELEGEGLLPLLGRVEHRALRVVLFEPAGVVHRNLGGKLIAG